MSKRREDFFTSMQLALMVVMIDHVGAGIFTSVNRHDEHVKLDESFTKFLRTGERLLKKTGIELRVLSRNSMLFKVPIKRLQLLKKRLRPASRTVLELRQAMKAENFTQANRLLEAPSNWDSDKRGECQPLPIYHGGGLMVSCWSLSWLERLRVLFSGRLWLTIVGDVHPAVALSAEPVSIPPRVFLSEDQIVADLLARIKASPAAIDTWLKVKQESLIEAHHTVGRSIRNDYGLWDERNPHVVLDPPPNEGVIDHPDYPDQMSHRIIERVWKEVHASVSPPLTAAVN
jgi:hypothetical protein